MRPGFWNMKGMPAANPQRAKPRRATYLLVASDVELTMLKELADHDGVSVADVLRQFIRRAYRKKIGPMPQPKAKAAPKPQRTPTK